MIPKLNLFSTLAALALFFLPWIDIRCSDQHLASQSGIQAIYGGLSPEGELKEKKEHTNDTKPLNEFNAYSILVTISLITILAAIVISFSNLRYNVHQSPTVGILCLAASLALIIQASIGFPVKRALLNAETAPDESFITTEQAKELMNSLVQFNLTPFFYLELIALGLPVLILFNRILDKMKKQEHPPQTFSHPTN